VIALAVLVVFVALPELIAALRKDPGKGVQEVNQTLSLPEDQSTIDLLKQLNGLAIVGTALSAVWAFVARRGKTIALAVATVAAPIAIFLPLVIVAEEIAAGGISSSDVTLLGGAIAVAALFWFLFDLNQWSLNPFYRRRLGGAFFVRREADGSVSQQSVHEPVKFSELATGDLFPELIVCAAANVSDEGVTPPGRNATSFRFSKEAIGGPLLSEPSPSAETYEQAAKDAGRDASIPAAVAVSGAAVSPTMGKKTLRAFTMLLTLTNVRLGVWLPNPARLPAKAPGPTLRARLLGAMPGDGGRVREWLGARRPGPHYLFKEMFGQTRITDRYLYVTDGGHYDNLGLVELLRQGCTTVFCLDGGGDAAGTYQALGEAVALARSELGVDVQVDPLPIAAANKKEFAPTDHVLGRIRYRGTTGEAPMGSAVEGTGTLVYCRAAVTEDAPWDVRDFRSRDPRFPIHSTLDQLFNDQKFESYRALGGWTARRALKTWQRRVLLDAVRRTLIERARTQGWFCHDDLVAEVRESLREEFGLREAPTWAPPNQFLAVLGEISSMEEAAQRPPLALIVQERRPRRALRRELTPVWDYWASSEAAP